MRAVPLALSALRLQQFATQYPQSSEMPLVSTDAGTMWVPEPKEDLRSLDKLISEWVPKYGVPKEGAAKLAALLKERGICVAQVLEHVALPIMAQLFSQAELPDGCDMSFRIHVFGWRDGKPFQWETGGAPGHSLPGQMQKKARGGKREQHSEELETRKYTKAHCKTIAFVLDGEYYSSLAVVCSSVCSQTVCRQPVRTIRCRLSVCSQTL